MANMYINPMNGQRVIAESAPPGLWCCLGEAVMTQVAPPANANIDMTVGDDFTPEDDMF